MSSTILLVDDDPSVVASLGLLLKQAGYRSRAASSAGEAVKTLSAEPIDLVIQDMNFSRNTTGEEGLRLLAEIKAKQPAMPVILMTGWGSIALAVEGVKAGASDFITKPWTNEQLLQSVRTALNLAQVRPAVAGERAPTREELDTRYDFSAIVGGDPKLVRALELAGRVSATDAPVLITGESGTGKELVAEAIHRNSARAGGPFVKVNIGGITASLFDSEMFGHVKGAFTDAHQDRRGRFQTAAGGTIFFDEIGDLDASCQVKMLRVLQDRTFEPLGSSETRSVDVRVISATNADLARAIARGAFREDLLYRLNLVAIHLPALRERRDDIPLLANYFLQSIANVYRRAHLTFEGDAVRWLQNRHWPGNIRELKHLIERAVIMGKGDALGSADLAAAGDQSPAVAAAEALPPVGGMTLEEMERGMILKSIDHFGGNVSRVAESLGLSRAALYRRLEKFGIRT